jgi:hypothetical protein
VYVIDDLEVFVLFDDELDELRDEPATRWAACVGVGAAACEDVSEAAVTGCDDEPPALAFISAKTGRKLRTLAETIAARIVR